MPTLETLHCAEESLMYYCRDIDAMFVVVCISNTDLAFQEMDTLYETLSKRFDPQQVVFFTAEDVIDISCLLSEMLEAADDVTFPPLARSLWLLPFSAGVEKNAQSSDF